MDSSRFDALTRTLRSRRAACNTLIGGAAVLLGLAVPEEADAHNFVARCRKLSDPAKRRACLRRARAHKRNKHSCKPKPPVTFCGTRCGTAINNCKKRVNCPTVCPAGKGCLINGSCAQACSGPGCPVGCVCNGPEVGYSGPAGFRCMEDLTCLQALQVCESTADCPLGSFCFRHACPVPGDQQNRCFPLCTG